MTLFSLLFNFFKMFRFYRFSKIYFSAREFRRVCEYRYIQQVANLCNDIQQKIVISTLLSGAIVLLGVNLALLIRFTSGPGNTSLIMITGTTCVETGVFLIFSLHGMAEINHHSKSNLQRLKGRLFLITGRENRRWTQRFIKSCAAIKIKFGGNNFVERLTPLNCISHALQISVQILLLGTSQTDL